MNRRIRLALLIIALGTASIMVAVFRPQAEEVDESDTPTVSETDVQTYIKVYSAMQDDHDLTIDNAIKPYNVSLDDFRQIERRIQGQARLVDRVRQALLEHQKERSVYAQSMGTPTPGHTPAAKPSRHKKEKKKKGQ